MVERNMAEGTQGSGPEDSVTHPQNRGGFIDRLMGRSRQPEITQSFQRETQSEESNTQDEKLPQEIREGEFRELPTDNLPVPFGGGGPGGGGEGRGGDGNGDGGSEYDGSQERPPHWWPFSEGEWKDLDLKDRTVGAAVLAMRHYYDMSNEERAANAGRFLAAYRDFSEFALGKKLYDGKDTRIIALELDGENFDKKEIQKYSNDRDRQQQLIETLYRLDFLEHEEQGIVNGFREYKIPIQNVADDRLRPSHFSKEEWKRYLERPAKIAEELQEVRRRVAELTSQAFLDSRRDFRQKLEGQINKLKEEIGKEEKEKYPGIEIELWEKELEVKLAMEAQAPLDAANPYAQKSCQEILDILKAEEEKSPDQQNQDVLEQANKALEWNFHEARKLGIIDDLEERLNGRYQELALSLFSRGRVEQSDLEMETRRTPRNLNLDEVKEIIARESDEDNPGSFPNMTEAQWKYLIREGLSREDVARFSGIRKAFAQRAYDQMYDSLSNLYIRYRREELRARLNSGRITQQQYDRISRLRIIRRMSGEWDVRRQERVLNERLEAEAIAEEEKSFYIDRYYLTLTGTTIEQVERGVNNYLKSLLEGAHVYDVQTVLSKLQYLSAAIFATKDTLLRNGVPGAEADEALTRIAIFAENRGDFYVMNFAAQNLLMDEYFIPLYDKWGGVIGIEKMKMMLDMNNGMIAPAMLLLLDKKNQLLFQPGGFKGQEMNNTWAQRTLRLAIRERIAKELVNFQAVEVDPGSQLYKTKLMEQGTWQDFLRMRFTERKIKPADIVKDSKKRYEDELARVRRAYEENKATDQDLDSLRDKRAEYTRNRREYDRLITEAQSAIDATLQIFNVFGETACLGAPSIIMDNGDHISIEDVTYVYKWAIMDAMRKTDDSPAMMRWRAYQWVKEPGKVVEYDDQKNPIVKKKIGDQEIIFKLAKGLEDTGMMPEEYKAFMKAVKTLRNGGYTAVFESLYEKDEHGEPVKYSFEEIINRNDVRPVRNNFISNYKSSRDIFANPTAIREAKKGRQPFIMNILERLDQSGRGKFTDLDRAVVDGKPAKEISAERLKEIFEDAITDSFIFHLTVRQLARWEASLQSSNNQGDISYEFSKFSTDRIDYGSQDIPWGVKRLQYLSEYWMTNKRERVGRAWQLLPFVPLLKSSLAQECDAENLPDLIFNVNKEHIDEPGFRQIAAGYKDAQGWRQRGETSVDNQRGETSWAWWDKPTVDFAQILKIVPKLPMTGSGKNLKLDHYINDPKLFDSKPLNKEFRKELVDVAREILKREAPLNVFLEDQLSYNRSAGGSGIGVEMGERWHYRILNWWLSEQKGSRAEQGGLKVNEDAATFLKFITIKGSWAEGMSILDEAWRQARGTRDAGVSDALPKSAIGVITV